MEKSLCIFTVPHTHWDRAWYLNPEAFKIDLIELFDRIFLFLTDKKNPPFLLDGQTIVLEDYLDLMPEEKERIRRLVADDRLHIGPFYVQIDQILAHPEAIVRNLLLGQKDAEKIGRSIKIGYFPDTWGQPPQMPQILRQFGITKMIFGRGYKENLSETGVEFFWRGIDGSKVLAVFMPKGYVNGINLGYPVKWGDPSSLRFDIKTAYEDIQRETKYLEKITNTASCLLMLGGDHHFPDPRVGGVLIKARNKYNLDIRNSGIEEYIRHVDSNSISLPVYEGKLNYGKYSYIVSGTVSARTYLKKTSDMLCSRVVHYTEPLLAFAVSAGNAVPHVLIETLWKLLLQNLSHDEIGGCGIDSIHREMICRWERAEAVIDYLERIGRRTVAYGTLSKDFGKRFIVFNPTNTERNSFLHAIFHTDDKNGYLDDFELIDKNGETVPFQLVDSYPVFSMEINSARRGTAKHVVFKPDKLPVYGFDSYYIRKATSAADGEKPEKPRERYSFENDYFGFSLTEKSVQLDIMGSRHVLRNFLFISDDEDAGDEYNYAPIENHLELTSEGISGDVTWLHRGPYYYSIKKKFLLSVPDSLDRSRRSRSDEHVEIPVELIFSALSDSPVLDVKVRIDNRADNHRMRINFRLDGYDCRNNYRGGHFCYELAEKNDTEIPSSDWREPFVPLRSFFEYVLFSGGNGTIAILSRDAREYEIPDENTAAFTLFRGVGDLSRDDLTTRKGGAGFSFPTPDAQCRGEQEWNFGIRVGAENEDPVSVYKNAERFLNRVLTFPVDDPRGILSGEIKHPDLPNEFQTYEPERRSIFPEVMRPLAISAEEIVITSLYPKSDGKAWHIRLVNYSDRSVTTAVRLYERAVAAGMVDPGSEKIETIRVSQENGLELSFSPFEIKTLEVGFS